MRNVLIADDHAVTRRGLKDIIGDVHQGVAIAEAADADQTLALFPTKKWDLVLLDVLMPGATVLDVIARIRQLDAATPILILTAAKELEYVIQTMRAGANGVIHKDRAADDLLEAIQKVTRGETYLHPETAASIASSLREEKPALPHDRLSGREREIFQLIAKGRVIKEIASDLGLSDKTVATYLARIREKTGLTSHVEIARYALMHRLVD